MNENQNAIRTAIKMPERVPLMQVRTNVRGGESLEACMKNLETWQKEYYKWYEQAKYKHV